ncbi:MAG TPA: DUF4404 family protein [Acidimicrobiales bacterium]|jgi:hypothetical protein|nr:DUF4404 family protein [Acidimicrobiales bacterium]
MDLKLRQMLDELAERLHLHRGPGEERAQKLRGEVQKAIETDDHQGLSERFTQEAVEFESDHPELADFLRRIADAFGAAGI